MKCRFITCPVIANERLKRNRAGQVVLQLKSLNLHGTTYIVMSPLQFMQRIAALVYGPISRRMLFPDSILERSEFVEMCSRVEFIE